MNPAKTFVAGEETIKLTEERRTRKFLWFFDVEWWEIANREHVGNDIHIRTDHKIDHIYLNGKKMKI